MDRVTEYIMNMYRDRARRGGKVQYRGEMDYDDDDYEIDGRRGVRGSGRRRRRDRADSDDYDDYDDYESDGRRSVKGTGRGHRRDYGENDVEEFKEMLYHKMRQWIENLENTDGSDGPRFNKEKVCEVADHMDLQMRDFGYSERDLYMTANMLYSDFGKTLSSDIPKEKELQRYVQLAKDFLEDDDANLTGRDKLVMYYCDIVKSKIR